MLEISIVHYDIALIRLNKFACILSITLLSMDQTAVKSKKSRIKKKKNCTPCNCTIIVACNIYKKKTSLRGKCFARISSEERKTKIQNFLFV